MAFIITLLSAISVQAQLRFDTTENDFGTLAEEGGKRSCTFRATNIGEQPVVLVDVVTTCGCTVPTFSRKPIRPGEKSEIVVTYDPYGRPGSFHRKLFLYGAGNERLAELVIRGEVTPRERTVEELYPIVLAEGVRASATLCTFSYIYIGQPMRGAISLINTSQEPRRFELRPTRRSGLLEVEAPQLLAAGERAAVNFCYRVPAEQPCYGTLRDAMEVWVDGQRCESVFVTHGIAVDRPTKSTKELPPKVELSENILKFGAVKQTATPVVRRFTLRNVGQSRLVIRAVEHGREFSTSLRPGTSLEVGETLTCEVEFDPAHADYGFLTSWLVLITNDPNRPMRRMRMTATIED